ncbi:hypothetical protein Tco_1363750 [Tanacetum coccineum]
MPYPRFTNVIINHFLLIRHGSFLHTIKYDSVLGKLKSMSKGEEHQKYEMSILDSIMNDAIRSLDSYQTYLALSTNTKAAIPKKERQRLSVVLKKATTPRKKSLITANDNILPDPDEALKPGESMSLTQDEIL